MKTVSVTFVGDGSDEVAQAFYTWFVDGGLEDQVIQVLTENTAESIEVKGITEINNDDLTIAIGSSFSE